jgi:translocator protein
VLALSFDRLSRERASGTLERAALRFPIALYTGWVSLATVAGTAATGVRLGLPGDGALATIAAVLILLVTAGIVSSVVVSGTAVVGYTVAVVWALVGIALNDPPAAVGVAAAVATVVVLFTAARRVSASGDPRRAAWG